MLSKNYTFKTFFSEGDFLYLIRATFHDFLYIIYSNIVKNNIYLMGDFWSYLYDLKNIGESLLFRKVYILLWHGNRQGCSLIKDTLKLHLFDSICERKSAW